MRRFEPIVPTGFGAVRYRDSATGKLCDAEEAIAEIERLKAIIAANEAREERIAGMGLHYFRKSDQRGGEVADLRAEVGRLRSERAVTIEAVKAMARDSERTERLTRIMMVLLIAVLSLSIGSSIVQAVEASR